MEDVKRIVDGDTLETKSGRKVRLIGVNTPESVGKAKYYGKEASRYTEKQLKGKTVYLFRDAGDEDKYGRSLRYVFIQGDALMFNEKLVAEGYANPMTIPPNVLYAKRFVDAEREARSNNKGLWGKADSPGRPASQAESPGGKPASSACADPKIKGNINAKREKIYHQPGGQSYEQTAAEELFCTANEARAAGYRKAEK